MKKIILYILFLSSITIFKGQDFLFKAYVDQNTISSDDYVRYTVESSERVRLNNLKLKDFNIRQGPFTSCLLYTSDAADE